MLVIYITTWREGIKIITRLRCSGIWRIVVYSIGTNVSEELDASMLHPKIVWRAAWKPEYWIENIWLRWARFRGIGWVMDCSRGNGGRVSAATDRKGWDRYCETPSKRCSLSRPPGAYLRERIRDEDGSHGHKSATSKESFRIEESQSARIPDGSEASSTVIAVRLCCN
jgi:hypothetical protein